MPTLPMAPTYERGHVRSPDKDHLQLLSARRSRLEVQGLMAVPPPPTWDSRTLGWIPPIKNQASCGSCWDFSGTALVEIAYWKAGLTDVILSEEYTLSCGRNGGCNGDDNTTVLAWAKATGLPLTKDYGAYTARRGVCAFKQAMTLYKIDDWGFAAANGDQGQHVTPTADIKASIMDKGAVGCAVAATSTWDNWPADPNYVHKGNSNSINHDVVIIGWNDALGAWLMRNSWGLGWANQGYGWIAYGADCIGTESVWAKINAAAPPIDWFV